MEISNEINKEKNTERIQIRKITDIITKNRFNLNNSLDFQKDLLFFKNDILKDMHNLEVKQNEKLVNYNEDQIKILNSYEKKILEQNEKISYLSNMITDYFQKQKFENYFEDIIKSFKKTLEKMDAKIISLQNDLKDVLYKQENYFKENILYPGIIGYKCKFKDFHAFIDYVLESINQMEHFQDLIKSYDLSKIRKNLEKDLNMIKLEMKNNFQVLSRFTSEKVNESEKKILQVLDDYNTQFVDVRMDNNKNAQNLENRINEVSHNFDQIIKIRKEMNKKNEETDRKIENIIQNIAENKNKLNEQNYEINNVDTKFKLLTTFIDNQNEENFNNQNSYFHIGNINHKYNKLKRVQSAKAFIERELKLMSRENNNTENKTLSLNKTGYNFNNSYSNNIRTININNNKGYQNKNFVINKKMVLKGNSFIKRYITGKIGIDDMHKTPKDKIIQNKNESSPSTGNIYITQNENRSKFFSPTKFPSIENNKNTNILLNIKKNKPRMINIINNNFQKTKFIPKTLSDGNYNSLNTKLSIHENFIKEMKNFLYQKNKYPTNTSYNKLIEQQLIKDKNYNQTQKKRRKKLLIIQ